MKVLLFKETTDKDLCIYLNVIYKDKAGNYTKKGMITKTEKINGLTFYSLNTSKAVRPANELKLIK